MEIDALVPLLSVADAGRSIAFYTEVLPFEVAQESIAAGSVRWALLRCGPAVLMVEQSDPPAGSRGVRLQFHVEDVHAARDALQAKGVATTEIRLTPYGALELRLRDPDGHELAVASAATRIA